MMVISIDPMNGEGQRSLVKKRQLYDYQSHAGLYHYHKQGNEVIHHMHGQNKQWTLWKEVNRDKLEDNEK